MSKNELIKNTNTDLIFSDEDQGLMAQMIQDSDDYGHSVDQEDIITPRLKLIQALSPELKKADPKYIEGIEAGDMIEALSKQVFKADEGLLFIPIKNIVNYLEWQGIGSNSKLINNYGGDATFYLKQKSANQIDDKGKVKGTKSDSRVIKTYNFYGFIYDTSTRSVSPLVIPMSGSKSKIAKGFNSVISMRCDQTSGKRLPAFAGIYRIKSTPETYNGESYLNYEIKPLLNSAGKPASILAIPEVGSRIYMQAKETYDSLKELTPNLAFKDEVETDDRM